MILDTLDNFDKYVALNPLFPEVAAYLKNNNLAAHALGQELIIDEELFVNYCEVKGKTLEEAKVETHNKMIDIQIPVSSSETMRFTPRKNLPDVAYDAEKDISFYDGAAEKYVTVNPGEFIIFFPQDGHAPCISESKEFVKVIFKIKA